MNKTFLWGSVAVIVVLTVVLGVVMLGSGNLLKSQTVPMTSPIVANTCSPKEVVQPIYNKTGTIYAVATGKTEEEAKAAAITKVTTQAQNICRSQKNFLVLNTNRLKCDKGCQNNGTATSVSKASGEPTIVETDKVRGLFRAKAEWQGECISTQACKPVPPPPPAPGCLDAKNTCINRAQQLTDPDDRRARCGSCKRNYKACWTVADEAMCPTM